MKPYVSQLALSVQISMACHQSLCGLACFLLGAEPFNDRNALILLCYTFYNCSTRCLLASTRFVGKTLQPTKTKVQTKKKTLVLINISTSVFIGFVLFSRQTFLHLSEGKGAKTLWTRLNLQFIRSYLSLPRCWIKASVILSWDHTVLPDGQ